MEENKSSCPEENLEQEETNLDDAAAQTDAVEEEKVSAKEGKEKKKVKKLEEELEKAKIAIGEEQDKFVRLYAEYDNFRKRSAKEREGIYADAYCDALSQIIPVLDNLERAAQFNTEEAESPMAKGLDLTLKSFIETLNKMGVYEIEALGKEFDPNLHNAVMHIEDETVGENTVVEVFMKGYKIGKKVIRHAMVQVAN